ncbi:MAG: hypothetical protein PHI48_09135 [Bacteroidales bacterium]|nr:hypothetical protein [Bacteroidales bacterium]
MKNVSILIPETIVCLFMLLIAADSYAYDPTRIKRPYSIGVSDRLPDGWGFKAIGNTNSTNWCYKASNGLFYMKVGGDMMNNNGDDCAFIYYENDQDAQIEARVMDAEMDNSAMAKGFVMVRKGMAINDPMGFLEAKALNNSVSFCWRVKSSTSASYGSSNTKSSTKGSTHTPPDCFPRWLKLVRQGKYVEAYHKDDVENAEWVKVGGIVNVGIVGKAYMGIGASSLFKSAAEPNYTQPAIFLFDNVVVKDVEIPYEVLNPQLVAEHFYEYLKPGRSLDINVTKLFGHALGEYFTVECQSMDPTVLEAYSWERLNVPDIQGENYTKYIRVKGLREGVTSLKLSCTIKGFTMQADFTVVVSNGKSKPMTLDAAEPFGWKHINLEIPIDPNLVSGEPFANKRLLISKKLPTFLGSWEYDWGGKDVGNHAMTPRNNPPTGNTSSDMYVSGAVTYDFREEWVPYTTADNYAKDTIRAEINGAYGCDVDLAFKSYTFPNNKFDTRIFLGFVDTTEAKNIDWTISRGLFSRRITQGGYAETGFPYITNIKAGDWVTYTVYAPREGYYLISPFTAFRSSDRRSIRIDVNGIMQVKELILTKGKGGIDWVEGTRTPIFLKKGENQLKIIANTPDFNFLGLKMTFHTAKRVTYSGLSYNATTNFRPEIKIDTTLMSEEEIATYDSITAIYGSSPMMRKFVMDSILLTYPRKTIYDTLSILDRYASRLDSMHVPYATHSEKLSALDTIATKIVHTIDSITFYTNQRTEMKHIDLTSFLYKSGFDPRKPIEVSMKIDSVSNSGIGTYMGIMARAVNKGELASNSPFVSFGIGAYEGGHFSYRWAYDYDLKKLDKKDIAQDVYIRLRFNFYAQDYVTAYYSYDGRFWSEFNEDPLQVQFFSGDNIEHNLAIGMYLTGGDFTGDVCMAMAKVSNFSVKQYDSMKEFERQYSSQEMYNTPFSMSSTTLRRGQPVDITYNVIKPGRVSIKVFDSYGSLKEVLTDEDKPFSKEAITKSYTISGLSESGIYLLQFEGPDNEQYLRFRYLAE